MMNLLSSFGDNVIQIADLGLSACAASFTLERNVTQITGRAPEVLAARSFPTALTAGQGSMDIWGAGAICGAVFWVPFVLEVRDGHADEYSPGHDQPSGPT